MYNRKLNPPEFRIQELSLGCLVRRLDNYYTCKVTGLDLAKQKVMVENTKGIEVIESILNFKELEPVGLWDHNNMMDPYICRTMNFAMIDSWEAQYGFYEPGKPPQLVTLINKFPLNNYALFSAKDFPGGPLSVPVWFAHEVFNLLELVGRGFSRSLT